MQYFSLYKNMMVPVDLGEGPYEVEAALPTATDNSSQEDDEKWDWNMLFAPMNGSKSKPKEDAFKYTSPFRPKASKPTTNTKPLPQTIKSKTDPNKVKTDSVILSIHGYKSTAKLHDSLQGCIYEGETVSNVKEKKRKVIIKKTLKSLHNQQISIQGSMNVIVDENIVKEAIISHHLNDNNVPSDAIAQLYSFFETNNAYFVVMEHCGHTTLKQFVDIAHKYIALGKLKVSHWRKICKYILWQLIVTLSWMHNDMNCVHLDLKMENIMVQNGNFMVNRNNNTVTIDKNVSCKIIDFGMAEIFKNDLTNQKTYFEYNVDNAVYGTFHLNSKYGITSAHNHTCPQIFKEEVYDGRKADIWSFGVILFYMSYGMYPYQKLVSADHGFWSCKHGRYDLFLDMHHLSHLFDAKTMQLIYGCLCIEEQHRFLSEHIMCNVWFKSYFKRYSEKLKQQSKEQLIKNISNQRKADMSIPYYKPT